MGIGIYSKIVRILRYFLPILGIVLLLTMFIWPLFHEKEKTVVLNLTGKRNIATKIEPVMVNPRFHGMDKYNQQFYISAKEAKQLSNTELELKDITSDITTRENDWASLIAKQGRLLHEKMYLYLDGDINIIVTDKNNDAYNIRTEQAEYDAKNSILLCTSKIFFNAPFGKAEGNSCRVDKDNKTMVFEDGIKMTITKFKQDN